MKRILIFFTFWGLLWVPSTSMACSVCFVGKEDSIAAYLWTAIFLSLLPLGMVAGISFWFYRRYQQNDSSSMNDLPENNESFYSNQQTTPTS